MRLPNATRRGNVGLSKAAGMVFASDRASPPQELQGWRLRGDRDDQEQGDSRTTFAGETENLLMPAIIGPEVMKHDAIAGSATALRSLKAGLKPRLIDCIMAVLKTDFSPRARRRRKPIPSSSVLSTASTVYTGRGVTTRGNLFARSSLAQL